MDLTRFGLVQMGAAAFTLIFSLVLSPAAEDVSPDAADPDTPNADDILVTIFEDTSGISEYSFPLAQLMTTGGVFYTKALYNESYTVTSDGRNITIGCYQIPPYDRTGVATGNNIVAVKMDGVPGYPAGLWASVVVGYTVGYGGIAESRFNALGPATQVGPFGDYLCTFMGDYASEIVLGFTYEQEVLFGSVDFDPDVLKLASKGRWVTCYIELPDGYSVADVTTSTIVLNGVVPADLSHKAVVGDADNDEVPDLMVKFGREAVQSTVDVGPDQGITVCGVLLDGTVFVATDLISVLDSPGKG